MTWTPDVELGLCISLAFLNKSVLNFWKERKSPWTGRQRAVWQVYSDEPPNDSQIIDKIGICEVDWFSNRAQKNTAFGFLGDNRLQSSLESLLFDIRRLRRIVLPGKCRRVHLFHVVLLASCLLPFSMSVQLHFKTVAAKKKIHFCFPHVKGLSWWFSLRLAG